MAVTAPARDHAARAGDDPTRTAPGRQPWLLEADSLYRFYRVDDEETLALRGVSLHLLRGEMVAVTGPSGSGKSTLLACLAGLDEPSGGTVWVNGARMTHQPESIRARLRAEHIGVLFQSNNLFGQLTLMDNLRLSQRLGRRGSGLELHTLLTDLGIAHRSGAFPSELSGGEAARASLAMAVANDPHILIADEPTGELDSVNEARLLDLLTERVRRGRGIVIASHSRAVANRADRVITLIDGQVKV